MVAAESSPTPRNPLDLSTRRARTARRYSLPAAVSMQSAEREFGSQTALADGRGGDPLVLLGSPPLRGLLLPSA